MLVHLALQAGPARRRLADVLGLAFIFAVLLDLLHPSLLFLPTITAGGDTPCHYPTAVWLKDQLLPQLRLHGWYPGTYLGQPLLLTYFPLPFVLMAALAPLTGMPVAFKLGTVLGVFLLPLSAYVALRRMRLPFPAPLLGAAAALVFLYVEKNPIWGGTVASTLTGEFAYTYGVGLATLFLGELLRAREDGRGPWLPAVLLALVAYAHGYAVLWAGLTASGLLLWDRRPLRALGWLAAVAALAFALAAPLLLPLLAAWGWTTPYDDAWIDITTRGLLPALLWPLFACAAAGIALMLSPWRRAWRLDRRLLLLAWGAVSGAALTCAGPGLGVIDVRFAPFAQLALALCGAAVLGLAVGQAALADLLALGLVLLAALLGDRASRVIRPWSDWNYSGLEAKELWPAWSELCTRIRGDVSDPRVSVEYDPVHERAGSLRMYETLFFFSGRATLEGVYNQASTTTHPVYFLASELFARSPNPFRSRRYSRFDPENALARLRLFNVGTIVATSPALVAALEARADVVREATIPPYAVFRLKDPGPGYVEPLAYEPVRAERRDWRDQSYRWFTRKPPNRALLAFSDDARFTLAQPDPWGLPPERPLPGGVQVRETLGAESLRIETSRPGHPLLVKISYHPRWRAEGAAGPYLVSPGLMLIVPERREVRLYYETRTVADWLGLGLALAAAGAVAFGARRDRRRQPAGRRRPADSSSPAALRRLALRALPIVMVLGLASLRLLAAPASEGGRIVELWNRATLAYGEGRWAEAAELARYGAELTEPSDPRWGALQCLRGDALLKSGDPRMAKTALSTLLDAGQGPHRAQALYLAALAHQAIGESYAAAELRRELSKDHPDTPWAARWERDREAER
jgi:hypothetical protein